MDKLNKTSLHVGHRQRLKARVDKYGLDALEDHEILEFLLSYCIPYKDTNALAHTLIQEFGGFNQVFNQSIDNLCSVDGIQNHTALFLSNMNRLTQRIEKSSRKARPRLQNPYECDIFFRKNFYIDQYEELTVACVDVQSKLVRTITCESTSPTEIQINLRHIASKMLPTNTAGIVLFHTHPAGNPTPSEEDISNTHLVMSLCTHLGITLFDHIIISDYEMFSMESNHLLEDMRKQCSDYVVSLTTSKEDTPPMKQVMVKYDADIVPDYHYTLAEHLDELKAKKKTK